MSAHCDDCGRIVPPEERLDGPYVTGAGRWVCGTCIAGTFDQVERWWGELKGTEAVPDPMDALRRRFLDQLGQP